MSLASATADVLALFTLNTGVRAVDDARDVNPPCVYVMPPQGSLRFDRGTADVTWTAYLITGNPGARHATKALSDLLERIAGVFPVTTFNRAALILPTGGDPVPAYELTWKSLVQLATPTAPAPRVGTEVS